MKGIIYLILFFIGFTSQAQQFKIRFEYDITGNQVKREYCYGCTARTSNNSIKNIAELRQEDLKKFSPNDVISYYPNPVKEELFLKWEILENNSVKSIEIYSLNGNLLKRIENTNNLNNYNTSFQNYPEGIYIVNLNYSNGDVKSIKILKK